MAQDLEQDVPELEEHFEIEDGDENMTLIEPAEDKALFDLEAEPVSMNIDPYNHDSDWP